MILSPEKAANKALRDSEEKMSKVFKVSPNFMALNTLDGLFLDVNEAFTQMFGYTRNEVLGRYVGELNFWPDLALRNRLMERLKTHGALRNIEVVFLHKNGRHMTFLWSAELLQVAGEDCLISTGMDISERKKNEEELRHHRACLSDQVSVRTAELEKTNRRLKALIKRHQNLESKRKSAQDKLAKALREKEILLREVHHRVKNNMAVINSLLQLQARSIESPEIRAMFKESQGRIEAMAMIHEGLYRHESLDRIDMAQYIRRLTQAIFNSYLTDHGYIDLFINVGDIHLGIDRAVPCGLIINELITNALKYAFPDHRKGVIATALSRDAGDHLSLTVEDDGIGLPADMDPLHADTLGMDLVRGLAQNQLGGTLGVDAKIQGTRFRIQFDAFPEEFH